jgi:maltose alpha-D-glucosyltransferase/alpha-amylase
MSKKSTNPLWFKDAIIYELHIKAFSDGNADGIGDFEGLIQRLDYLQSLGVTAIWLLPFYPSPQRDGGYDISDYYSINPDYGTIEQFQQLLNLAHERGLKVITELVINHTSDQHPWFQKARAQKENNPYRDYYVWSDTPDKYKDVRIIFQDFEPSNWTWDHQAEAYFWHRFYAHQPDLNYDNPKVQEEIFNILDFWIEMGVDGFRLDAIPYLFEREGTNGENLPETHVFLKKLRSRVEEKNPNVLLLAEANMWPEDSASYFGEGDECHMNYHFPIMPRMFMSLKMEDRYPIIDIIEQTPDIPENCQWGIFLRNHDELTLEMVTDEERDYMYRAYNKDQYSKVNLGIRHRLAPLLDNDRRKIELMNVLLFSLPGTPVLYYGDEIGMGDNVHLGDRDGVRTPMQWSIDRNGGFSQAHAHRLYLPMINDPEYHFSNVNVELQENSPSSLLWWMKHIMRIRKRYKVFGRGEIEFLSPENPKVLAFIRSYEDEEMLVLVNLSRLSQAVDLHLKGYEHRTPVEVFGQTEFPPLQPGNNRFTLGPYGYYWFELKKAEASVRSSAAPLSLEWPVKEWQQLANQPEMVETVLPNFMTRSPYYNRGNRKFESISIFKKQEVQYEGKTFQLIIFKVNYTEGFPSWYFLPLTNSHQEPYTTPVAILKENGQQTYLIDGLEHRRFQRYLLQQMLGTPLNGTPPGFQFIRTPSLESQDLPADGFPTTLHTTGTNFAASFNHHYFLKVFRKLEPSINPELEINQFASGKGLPLPGYLAHWQHPSRKEDPPFTLAMLQPYLENQGTAWQYFHDSASRYLERAHRHENVAADTEALIDEMTLHRARLLGQGLAELHLGLMADKADESDQAKGFTTEPFSLHYQRSLFAGWQSRIRNAFKLLDKQYPMPEGGTVLMAHRDQLLKRLKLIHREKLDALKIRVHGNLHLEKILFNGRDFLFFDFEGENYQNYSQIRLRKSPARDLCSLSTSLYYAALVALKPEVEKGDLLNHEFLPYAQHWYDKVSSAMVEAYQEAVEGTELLPPQADKRQLLLDTFLIDRFLYELTYELNQQRGRIDIPVTGLVWNLGLLE